MVTKIINEQAEFKPVKIELEFTNRQQLAAFIQIMYYPQYVAKYITSLCPYTTQAELMGEGCFERALDELIDVDTLKQLAQLADE